MISDKVIAYYKAESDVVELLYRKGCVSHSQLAAFINNIAPEVDCNDVILGLIREGTVVVRSNAKGSKVYCLSPSYTVEVYEMCVYKPLLTDKGIPPSS